MVAPALSRRTAWTIGIVAMLTMTVSYIDRSTLAVLAPTVTKALDISDAQYGWLTSAFSMAYLIATPVAGWWIDRVGVRRGLVASVLVWSTFAALHALVPGFGVLFALRIALGVTEGPSFPGAALTMARVLPPEDRSRGFGVLFTGSSIGGMIAPLLASWLYDLAGWRVAFLGTAVIGLSWIPLWLVVTRHDAVRGKLDARPAVAAGERPSLLALFRNPWMIRAAIGILAAAPATAFLATWGAKYLGRTFGVGQGDVGHFLWLPPLMQDLGLIAFGDLAARLRRGAGAPPRLLHATAVVMATSFVVLAWSDGPWLSVLVGGVAVAGFGGIYTLVTSDLIGRMPPSSVSMAAGVVASAQSLALIIANPLIGRSVDAYGDYTVAIVVLTLWVLPGSLIWQLWRPRTIVVTDPPRASS